jgi:vacuolar-type H+-ATPase subunit C/Vma6
MKKYDVFLDKVDEAFTIMKKNAEINAPLLDYEHTHYYQTFFSSESLKMWNELTNIFKANSNEANQTNLEMLFNETDGWGADFSEYCRRLKEKEGVVRNFFKTLPVKNIIEAIRKSCAGSIHQFRFGLKTIYCMSNMKDFFAEDLIPLSDFRQDIDGITFVNNPILCMMALELLKEEVDRIIRVLSEDCAL